MSFLNRLEKFKKSKEEEKRKSEMLEQLKKEKEAEWQKELAQMKEKDKKENKEILIADFRKKKEEEYRQKVALLKKQLDEEIKNLEERLQEFSQNQKEKEKEVAELSLRLQQENDLPLKNLEQQRLRILKKELEIGNQEFKKILILKANKERERALVVWQEKDLKTRMEKEISDYIQSLEKEEKAAEVLRKKWEKAKEIETDILLKSAEEKSKKEKTEAAGQAPAAPTTFSEKGFKKLLTIWEKATGKKLIPESSGPAPMAPGLQGLAELKVDFFKEESKIIIYALVPGARIEDIDISLAEENDVLTIKGLTKRPQKSEGGKFLFQECQWGPFFRQLNLNAEINVYGIKAKLENGVLILELPILKPGEEKSGVQKIKIEQ